MRQVVATVGSSSGPGEAVYSPGAGPVMPFATSAVRLTYCESLVRHRVTAEIALFTMFKSIIFIAFPVLVCQSKTNYCKIDTRTASVRWAKILCYSLASVITLIMFTHNKLCSVQLCACLTARLSELIVNQFYNTTHIYLHLLNATKTLFYLVTLVFIYSLLPNLSLTLHNLELMFNLIYIIYTIYTFIILYLQLKLDLLLILYIMEIESTLMILTSFMTVFVACCYNNDD